MIAGATALAATSSWLATEDLDRLDTALQACGLTGLCLRGRGRFGGYRQATRECPGGAREAGAGSARQTGLGRTRRVARRRDDGLRNMRHQIQSDDLRTPEMAAAIEKCVHCGFCLPACPTYSLLGEEMDSPRGRIYLMKNVLEERLTAEDAQPYLDRCLGCMACVPACPSGVEYGDLLVSYRALQEKERRRPPLEALARKLVIARPCPTPGAFGWRRKRARSGWRSAPHCPRPSLPC